MEIALFMARASDREIDNDIETAILVQRVLAGDPNAFEQIVRRHERRVLTLALRLLAVPDDAQDAAQEVFLRAFKYLHRLNLEKPIEPWLVRMTVNVCRDAGRKRSHRQNTFPELTNPELAPAPESANPHHELAGEQRKQLLWKALDTLPEKERLAVVLRDVEGFSTAEVAEILESSESTVRSQVSRARLRIKDAIDRMTGGGI
jgi:RNA polymerase sigma-70 factor, ECF subfamily